MVIDATVVMTGPKSKCSSFSGPRMKKITLRMAKAPALTTATPCRKLLTVVYLLLMGFFMLLTGVGATIAAGSHA